MKTETINAVACEFCGHSERFMMADQFGLDLDIYDVVRARICRHEQRCPENPLVKTIIDIREAAKALGVKMEENIRSAYDGKLHEELEGIIQKTYDPFGPAIERPDPKKRRPVKPTPIRHIEVSPGAVAVGSDVRIVSTRRKPGAVKGRRKGSSSYFGVTLNKNTGKWVAQVCRKGIRWDGGRHKFEEEAAIAVQEYLGNTAEADRIRRILAEKQAAAAGDKKQESEAAAGIDEIKGDITWQWECKGCGETARTQRDKCPKCSGSAFEKIPVLDDPQAFLDRPEGWHNPKRTKK